jgi:dihydroorotate dehydrogenase (NAD+) catalytic subunit
MCARASQAQCWPPIRFDGISARASCTSVSSVVESLSIDLSVQIGSLTLSNPVIAASGCFGYGVEYADTVDLSSLGAVAVKGLFLAEREGHPAPRIVETPAGMLNAIGLQGIGVQRFIDEKLPELRARRATVIVNVCGTTIDEYVEVSRILSEAEGVAAIELNISCPNIKEGGIQFGCSLNGTFDVVSAVRKATRLPIIPKLTPNVTSVSSFARAAEDAGADAVSLVNTFLAMVVNVETRRPEISNIVGGLSGPAIRPIAVRMVYECRQAVKIPIIGMGGIADARDAIEFMLVGASAVQVGTANFVDPFIWPKLLDGIRDYMRRHAVARAADLVGTVDTRAKDKEWISS